MITTWMWCATQASAGFPAPIPAVAGEATLELVAGETLEGRVVSATVVGGSVRKLKLKDAEGDKHKHKAAEVASLEVIPGKIAKAAAAMQGSSSLTEASRTDTSEIMGRDVVRYEQARLPNGKVVLLQLLNPGFDHLWRVYPDPNAQETATVGVGGIDVAGGADKSYLVAPAGSDQTIKVSKKNYGDLVQELYGDCPPYEIPDPAKFFDFADHLVAFDQMCAIRGPMPQGEISSLPPTGAPDEAPVDEAGDDAAPDGGDAAPAEE